LPTFSRISVPLATRLLARKPISPLFKETSLRSPTMATSSAKTSILFSSKSPSLRRKKQRISMRFSASVSSTLTESVKMTDKVRRSAQLITNLPRPTTAQTSYLRLLRPESSISDAPLRLSRLPSLSLLTLRTRAQDSNRIMLLLSVTLREEMMIVLFY